MNQDLLETCRKDKVGPEGETKDTEPARGTTLTNDPGTGANEMFIAEPERAESVSNSSTKEHIPETDLEALALTHRSISRRNMFFTPYKKIALSSLIEFFPFDEQSSALLDELSSVKVESIADQVGLIYKAMILMSSHLDSFF